LWSRKQNYEQSFADHKSDRNRTRHGGVYLLTHSKGANTIPTREWGLTVGGFSVFSRLFSRKLRTISGPARTTPSFVEGLEGRLLLTAAPRVTGVTADNRGEVTITLSRTVTGISKSSVKLFTVGANGVIGDADDIRQPSQVIYSVASAKLTIKGKLPANAGYRVRIQSLLVTSLDGRHLDGEYSGSLPSGDGHPGGNFSFLVKNDKSATPTARMYTSAGIITLKLRKDVAPNTVANFLDYANSGRYDNVFFTRSENNPTPFVIQGGSLQITGTGTAAADVKATTQDAPIADENAGANALSNTIGTLAFARSGTDSATNQFFINLADNSFLDRAQQQDGGFTVFATITSGLDAAQAINTKPITDLTSQIGTEAGSTSTGVDHTPVNDATAAATLNPFRDLQFIRRVAVLDKIGVVD
jgi:cyclophilin family peptidyl-prolyl cis-trans isomerase